MRIKLFKANVEDAKKIFAMQKIAFTPLLDKYGDYATNPAAENINIVASRFQSENIHTYFIVSEDNIKVGLIRILDKNEVVFLKQILIMPAYQKRGYACEAIAMVEQMYPNAARWELDTILQEDRLCRMYANAGYVPTGRIEKINENMSLIYLCKQL